MNKIYECTVVNVSNKVSKDGKNYQNVLLMFDEENFAQVWFFVPHKLVGKFTKGEKVNVELGINLFRKEVFLKDVA